VIPNGRAWTLIALAGARRRKGAIDEARVLLDDALEEYEALRLESGCAAALVGMSWCAIASNDLDGAMALADRGAPASRERHRLSESRLLPTPRPR